MYFFICGSGVAVNKVDVYVLPKDVVGYLRSNGYSPTRTQTRFISASSLLKQALPCWKYGAFSDSNFSRCANQ